jgi:hypothetical protein
LPKKENLFRFVSVRGPQTPAVDISIPGDERSKRYIDQEIERLKKEGLPLEQIRPIVGSKIVNEGNYFRRLEVGTILLQRASDVHSLLSRQRKDPNHHSYKRDLRDLLYGICEESLEDFLRSESYSKIKESLWTSFFGLVLSAIERPADRRAVDVWLRAFYLAEFDDDSFDRLARIIHKVRPSVPFSWFVVTSTSNVKAGDKPNNETSAGESQIELKKRLELYKKIRNDLHNLFLEKIRNYRYKRDRVKIYKTTEGSDVAMGAVGFDEDDPGTITEAELSRYEDIFSALRSLGLVPELTSIPELVNKLDAHIAKISADLEGIMRKQDIMLTGRSFVRIGRLAEYYENTADKTIEG